MFLKVIDGICPNNNLQFPNNSVSTFVFFVSQSWLVQCKKKKKERNEDPHCDVLWIAAVHRSCGKNWLQRVLIYCERRDIIICCCNLFLLNVRVFQKAFIIYCWRHVVIRAFPTTTEQLDVLKDWSAQSISFVDFWFLPTKIGKFVDIHVSPEWYNAYC